MTEPVRVYFVPQLAAANAVTAAELAAGVELTGFLVPDAIRFFVRKPQRQWVRVKRNRRWRCTP